MNREETIALWQKCEEARAAALAEGKSDDEAHAAATAIWNGWANGMLARKADMEKAGSWGNEATADFSALRFMTQVHAAVESLQGKDKNGSHIQSLPTMLDVKPILLTSRSASFRGWIFPGSAKFLNAEFLVEVEFQEAQFSGFTEFGETRFFGPAQFQYVQFSSVEFARAQFLNEAKFKYAHFDNARFTEAQFSGAADLAETRFSGAARFNQAQFSDNAEFRDTKFSGDAEFQDIKFFGDVRFDRTQFSGRARFRHTQFSGKAGFESAQFFADARFRGAQFFSDTEFERAKFEGGTSFKNARFEKLIKFNAMRSDSAFDLEAVIFNALPSFIQANFKEAPRLDHVTLGPKVEPGGFWRSLFVKSSKDVTSNYRALKRLAIQGHDHEREYLFFKGELRSRRTSEDRWWHSGYLLGILYDVVSDFGRSVWRPVLVWFLWAALLAKLYAVSAVPHVAASPIIRPGIFGGEPTLAMPPLDTRCADPFWEGFYLAVRNGFPLSGARDQRVVDGYSCLYAGSPAAPGAFPTIPGWITYAELAHTLGSVILIFLIALAIRNQFKIK